MGLVCAKNASEKFSRLGTFKKSQVPNIKKQIKKSQITYQENGLSCR
jgi:hypothetical protein